MAEVKWIRGEIDPPKNGEYYVTLEAKQNIVDPKTGNVFCKIGDIIIAIDFYYAENRLWEQLGEDNPFFGLVFWADIIKPNVPDSVREMLVEYREIKVKWENGHWCVGEEKNNVDA